MSTKIELETEVETLKRTVEQLQNQKSGLLQEINSLNTSNRQLNSALQTERALVANLHGEIYRIGDAWVQKWQEREIQVAKTVAALMDTAEHALKSQHTQYTEAMKTASAISAVRVERARTDTMADCFSHVAGLLADRGAQAQG